MRQSRWTLAVAAVAAVAAVGSSGSFNAALAHEHRTVGPVVMTVGWANEPTYVGFQNAVQLLLKDTAKKPIAGAGDTLKVEVVFGSQKTAALPLQESDEQPGEYLAPIIPTRPGNYTFHFTGTVAGHPIDQSFTSSDTTFDPAVEATGIEFPAKDPSAAELAGLVDRLGPRVDAGQAAARDAAAAASQARTLGIVGIIVGLVGIVVGAGATRRRATR